ncbi:MAG: hypothetical protein MJK18_15590, partial [Bdellovibrionales bacterium]|nr:hypothetical protein [Bdellovibrionales bacterium]
DDIEDLLESLTDYKLMGQIISISYLLKNSDINSFCNNLSMNADLVAQKLLQKLISKWNSQDIDILCLGKWAGNELGIQSDLDFVFVCDNPPESADMKVARRFINLMSTPTKAGRLYNIDIRLKPNQSSGPLLMKSEDLLQFMETKAEAWQKQAYLKSRYLNSSLPFYKTHNNQPTVNSNELNELKDIHSRLIVPKTDKKIDIKYNPGGLVETEFKLQWMMLKKGLVPTSARMESLIDCLDSEEKLKTQIYQNYLQLRTFEQIYQICLESSSTKVSMNNPVLNRLSKVLKIDDPFKHLAKLTERQHELLKLLDPTP